MALKSFDSKIFLLPSHKSAIHKKIKKKYIYSNSLSGESQKHNNINCVYINLYTDRFKVLRPEGRKTV